MSNSDRHIEVLTKKPPADVPPNTADACLNELCKQGKFEQRDGKIKIRLDNSL